MRWLGFTFASIIATLGIQPTDPFTEHTITAPDKSIRAKFIGSGASITELWVKDKRGQFRDVVLGYDNTTLWETDPNHPVFGSIVGRYANRIVNAYRSQKILIQIPLTPSNHIYRNGPDGAYAIHGGKFGWDRRNWTLTSRTPNSLTFSHLDAGDEGFPGNVTAKVVYTLFAGATFDLTIKATATQKTPIMLTSHIYWNLDAYQESQDIFDHRLRILASKVVEGDANRINIPTGNFTNVQGTALDFRKEQSIGYKWNETAGYGGCPVCPGYDNPWVFDEPDNTTPNLSIRSPKSGIKLDITTNQPVVQIYTANWLGVPRKTVHGGPTLNYESFSAVAIEPEGYVAAINNPEWGVDQIYGPERDFKWKTTYKFSTVR